MANTAIEIPFYAAKDGVLKLRGFLGTQFPEFIRLRRTPCV